MKQLAGYVPEVNLHILPILSSVLRQSLQDPSQLLPPHLHERVEDGEDRSQLRLRPPVRRHRRLQGQLHRVKPL